MYKKFNLFINNSFGPNHRYVTSKSIGLKIIKAWEEGADFIKCRCDESEVEASYRSDGIASIQLQVIKIPEGSAAEMKIPETKS